MHAMSHAAGRIARLNLHHGTLNAVFLPAVLQFAPNCEKIRTHPPSHWIGTRPDIAAAITAINADIGLPSGLQEMGVEEDDIPEMIAYAMKDLPH